MVSAACAIQSDNSLKISANSFPWYGIRVKSRFEKTASAILRGKGFEEFLPLYKSRNLWSDRTKFVDAPLFPGYVFCRFDVNQRLPILVTPGVVSILGVGQRPEPISEAEIEAIQVVTRSGAPLGPWPYLRAGQRVRIEHGAMKGIEGLLVSVKNGFRLVVSVTMLQRSLAVEIDRETVSPIL